MHGIQLSISTVYTTRETIFNLNTVFQFEPVVSNGVQIKRRSGWAHSRMNAGGQAGSQTAHAQVGTKYQLLPPDVVVCARNQGIGHFVSKIF